MSTGSGLERDTAFADAGPDERTAALQRFFPDLAERKAQTEVRYSAARVAVAESDFGARCRAARKIRPLRVPGVHGDPLHVQNAESLDPAWRIFVSIADERDALREEATAALASLTEPSPLDSEPHDSLEPVVLGEVAADGFRAVAERLWFDDSPDPWLWVQTLHVRARRAGEVRELPTTWPAETIGWLLTALQSAGLSTAEWVPEIRRAPADEFALSYIDRLPLAASADPDADPILTAVHEGEIAQSSLQQAEAARIHAVMHIWRTAMEQVAGTPDAAVNGPYQRAIQLQLAHTFRTTERTAMRTVHTAEDIETKLPETWSQFAAGRVPWSGMQTVHAAMDGLDVEMLPAFDAGVVTALGRVELPRLKDALRRLRERLQRSSAVERHRTAMSRRSVTLEPAPDGMAYLTWYGPAAEAIALDHQLSKAAIAARAAEGETRTVQQLRSDMLMDLWIDTARADADPDNPDVTVPARRGVEPHVAVLIPAMTAMGHSDVPATLQGYGPIDIETAKRLAGAAKSWVKVLTHPIDGAVLNVGRDRYRPTAEMRTLLNLLDGGGRGPGCTRPPGQTDADHVEPFRQGLGRG